MQCTKLSRLCHGTDKDSAPFRGVPVMRRSRSQEILSTHSGSSDFWPNDLATLRPVSECETGLGARAQNKLGIPCRCAGCSDVVHAVPVAQRASPTQSQWRAESVPGPTPYQTLPPTMGNLPDGMGNLKAGVCNWRRDS